VSVIYLLIALAMAAPNEPPPRTLKIDGVMVKNPAYAEYLRMKAHPPDPNQPQHPPKPVPHRMPNEHMALAVVSNMNDMEKFNEVNVANNLPKAPLAESMSVLIGMAQEGDIDVGIDGNMWVDALGEIFARYETPMGLMNKLMELERFDALHFVIDDSGSMMANSDVLLDNGQYMKRWEEAQQRLKTMMTVLALIPTKKIVVCFLNRCQVIEKQRYAGENPDQFVQHMHEQIDAIFRVTPTQSDLTPMELAVKKSLALKGKIARYFFGDGRPGPVNEQKQIAAIKDMIKNRANPQDNPVTFISCSNVDKDVEWMKEIEEVAPYCAEYDDYKSEAKEVLDDQGNAFPYTEGFHLIGQLVGAMNPEDLDALDEAVPLTWKNLNNILGLECSEEEYRYYFHYFLIAQSKREGTDAMSRVKKSQNWNNHLEEFMNIALASKIPAVQDFKNSLKRASAGGSSTGGFYPSHQPLGQPQNGGWQGHNGQFGGNQQPQPQNGGWQGYNGQFGGNQQPQPQNGGWQNGQSGGYQQYGQPQQQYGQPQQQYGGWQGHNGQSGSYQPPNQHGQPGQ
jgi:hypothetical protein